MLLHSKSREKRRNKQNYTFSPFSFLFQQQLTSKVHPCSPGRKFMLLVKSTAIYYQLENNSRCIGNKYVINFKLQTAIFLLSGLLHRNMCEFSIKQIV